MLHVWHAIMNKSVPSSAKQQREITMFTVLMTPWAYKCIALILCIYFHGAHTNPVIAYFAKIIEREQDGGIANRHNWAGFYFQVTFSLPLPSSLLNLPIIRVYFARVTIQRLVLPTSGKWVKNARSP